jgi:hypothetical protein
MPIYTVTTKTYGPTPVEGEAPTFVVTGLIGDRAETYAVGPATALSLEHLGFDAITRIDTVWEFRTIVLERTVETVGSAEHAVDRAVWFGEGVAQAVRDMNPEVRFMSISVIEKDVPSPSFSCGAIEPIPASA